MVGDLLALDEHVALVLIGGGDDRAVLDEQAHGSCSAIGAVGVGTAVAIELPHAPDLFDHVEVHLGDDELVLSSDAVARKLPRGSTKYDEP